MFEGLSACALRALEESATGEGRRRARSTEHIAFCAAPNVTDIVPLVVGGRAETRWPVVML
jgi:hypothetical protein